MKFIFPTYTKPASFVRSILLNEIHLVVEARNPYQVHH